MKLESKKSTKLGIAMTEYLIILAIVAIASIGTTSLFGKELKIVWNKCVHGMNPTAEQKEVVAPTMENFGGNNSNQI